MGLSIAIAGGITITAIMVLFTVLPSISDRIHEESVSTTEVFVNNEAFSKTSIRISGINASSGSELVNFTMTNQGNEKLWNFDEFDLFVTYDADVSGVKTRLIEQMNYNATAYTLSTSQPDFTADFKIQRDELIMGTAETSSTLTEGTDFDVCVGDCFIKLVNSRLTGTGRTDNGGTQGVDSWTSYISDVTGLTTPLGTITFTRDTTDSHDNRLQWEIWEYVGDPNGSNEVKVWNIGTCTFGAAATQCDGAVIGSFTGTDAKVVVYITGQSNPDDGTGDFETCITTSEWVGSGSNIPRFTRIGTGSDACAISYAVVEFSGDDWSVQRIAHSYTNSNPQSETIADIADITQTFFHHQQRNEDDVASDGICDTGSEVELTNPTTLTYRLPQSTLNWDSSMQGTTWIVSNLKTAPNEKMIVDHYNPAFQASGGAPEEHNWQFSINPLTYDISEAAITGLTAQSGPVACGNAYPRGSVSANLTDSSTADFWISDRGQNHDYTFQITQFPRSFKCVGGTSDTIETNEWSINCIKFEHFEPTIVNSGEAPEILTKLQYPVFANGLVQVTVTTDNGFTSGATVSVS